MEDRSSQIVAVMALFLALTWIAVPLRCWVRIKLTNSFATDDWLTVISLFLFTIYGGFVFMGAHWGTGRHLEDLSLIRIQMAMKAWYFGEIFYILSCTFLRLAVGFLLLRLAVNKTHKIFIHTLNGLNIIFNLYFVLMTIVQCNPPQNFWETGRTLHCIDPIVNVDSTFAQSAICAFIDWAFAVLPILLLWNLNMPIRKKIALGLLLSLGAVASTAPLIRIPYVITLAQTEDFLWVTVDVVIWSSVEPGLGITAISFATLRPLVRKYFNLTGFSANLASTEPYKKGASSGSAPTELQQFERRNAGLGFGTTIAETELGPSSVIRGGESDRNSELSKGTDEEVVSNGERTWTIVKTFDVRTESS